MRTAIHDFAISARAAGSALALVAGLLAAQPAAIAATAPAAPATLKRLPAGHDELVFRGEDATGAWQVHLSPTEAARITQFQLGMLNSVVDLPDRSFVKLTVNGRALPAEPVRYPDEITNVMVKIPPGVLLAGANTVQVSVALAHRVDCSVKATYELWALLDPTRTGFVIDPADTYAIRTLDELAAEPLGEDGATHIHVRMAEFDDPVSVARAARFVDALVRRAGLARPIVDVGPEAGRGPGFDVALAAGDASDAAGAVRVLGRDDDVTLARDATTNRLVLVLSGADDADLDARLAALDKGRPQVGAAGRASAEGVAIDGGERKTFAELGLATDGFAGRHFLASASVALPADFYPSGYEKARLLIDGYHSAALDGHGELIFRVNGAIVSSLSLAPGAAEAFDHQSVELPLRFFHPGHNEISVEGVASSALDQQCDVAAMPHEPRLTIAGSSALVFPPFARLGALPEIPVAIAAIAAPTAEDRPHLYLADLDRASVGAGLTILANMAATTGKLETPIVRLEPPAPGDAPGVVIGALDHLPDFLAAPLRAVAAPADADAPKPQDAALASDAGLAARLRALFASSAVLSKTSGTLFAANAGETRLPPLPEHFLLIGAVSPAAAAPTIGGVALPQFTRDASQWLAAAAQSPDALAKGVDRLVVDGQWRDLAGEAVSLDLDSGALHAAQPTRVAYVLPNQLALSDVRPILGGVLSDNILLTLGALLALVSILGLSTHALIRKSGVR
jgi:hypothetical protein